MRTDVKVLWFDDEEYSETILYLQDECKHIFERKGYNCDIESFNDYDEALSRLTNNERIDIIFTDFNVADGNEKDGVSFYLSARKQDHHKQHIAIYSSIEEESIKEAIIEAMKKSNLSDFSNFSFFSISMKRPQDAIAPIEKCIDVYLSRWKELNALRGRTMNEHAELEYKLKNLLDTEAEGLTYHELIKVFKRKYNDRSAYQIFEKWHELKNLRNNFAHVNEGLEGSQYFIELGDGTKVFESNIESMRIDLLNNTKIFSQLIEDYLNR